MTPGMKTRIIERDALTDARGVETIRPAVYSAVAEGAAVDVLEGVDFATCGPGCFVPDSCA